MATRRPWDSNDDKRLRELHTNGRTLHAIAQEMGRSKSTVGKHSKRLGLTWSRERSEKATEANVADARSRRAQLELDLLTDAQRLRAELWAEAEYAQAVGGMEPRVMRWAMAQPTPADKLKIMQAAGAAIDRSLKIAAHDSGAGTTQVVGLLQRTAESLGITDATDTGQDEP